MIKGMYDYSHSNSTLDIKGYKNSQGNGGFLEKITLWIFGRKEDNIVSKSRETPSQTASDYWDRPTG